MESFWFLVCLGVFFFLLLAGAGVNVYLRGKGSYYVMLASIKAKEEKK